MQVRLYMSQTRSRRNSFSSTLGRTAVGLRPFALLRSLIVVRVDLHLDIRAPMASGSLSPQALMTSAARSLGFILSRGNPWRSRYSHTSEVSLAAFLTTSSSEYTVNLCPWPSSADREAGLTSLSDTVGRSYLHPSPHSKRASAKLRRPRLRMLMPFSERSENPTVRSPSTYRRRALANLRSSSADSYIIPPMSCALSFPTQGLIRRIRLPRAWMVITSPEKLPPNSESTARRRSATVLLVSDMRRIPRGSTPESTRCLTFPTRVVVLPVPAAAMTSWVSASSMTAASCCWSRGWPLTTSVGLRPTMRGP